MEAEELELTQGGIGFARAGTAKVTAGAVGVVAASGEVELEALDAYSRTVAGVAERVAARAGPWRPG